MFTITGTRISMSNSVTNTDNNMKDVEATAASHSATANHNNQEELTRVPSKKEVRTKAEWQVEPDDGDDDASNNHPTSEHENNDMKRDTKRVIHLKVLVLLILLISAFIISVAVYMYIRRSETQQFQSKYYNDVNKVFTAVFSSIERTLGTLNAIAVSLVSYADNEGIEWPLVTLPNFALQASKQLPLTDGVYVALVPLVQPSQKQQWEEYAYQNDDWVNESLALQEVWGGYHGDITYNWIRNHSIYGAFGDIESNVSRYMLPQWQSFPVATPEGGYKLYNWDWNSGLYPDSVRNCIERQHTILSETYMLPFPNDDVANAEIEIWANFFTSFLPSNEESLEPMLDIYYPIINDLSSNAVIDGGSNNATSSATATIVGMLAIPIYWRSFLRNILTEGSDGIVVVVLNPCNQPFTYQINGPRVAYLGIGDLHDNKYDNLGVVRKVVELKTLTLIDAGYSGAPIDTEYCPYTLNIYPSDDMKDDFVSQDAVLFLVLVILIFLFTSCVFFIYDWYVERRQYRVRSEAMYSSAIVSSLFPSTVRERLYPKPDSIHKTKQRLSGCLSNPSIPINETCEPITPIIGDPIAHAYAETTVIFADIVGFTAWSSTRDPIQVFHLLETIYAGFDALAKVHGVFKIETIGDSYVAVVGLPKSQKRHAVIMARFASAIRTKMKEMTNELEAILGAGTSNLSLRIGLNSGPTIAGVLRGEKARFQLFGDTVNTAARMESNGEPDKIHISATTANLLKSMDKEHWLTAREEMIFAKGKGNMQTYWCEPQNENSSSNDDFYNTC